MSDAIRLTIAQLKEKLGTQEEEVIKTKTVLNSLYDLLGESPPFGDLTKSTGDSLSIETGAFFGIPFATAVKKVLTMRGKPMSVSEIVESLKAGGFDFSRSTSPEHSVRTSLGKNTASFIQIPNSDSFGLIEWYPEAKKPAVKKRTRTAKSNGQEPELTNGNLAEEPEPVEAENDTE